MTGLILASLIAPNVALWFLDYEKEQQATLRIVDQQRQLACRDRKRIPVLDDKGWMTGCMGKK